MTMLEIALLVYVLLVLAWIALAYIVGRAPQEPPKPTQRKRKE
jgi:hypothetical protein